MAKTVALIDEVFAGSHALDTYAHRPRAPATRNSLFSFGDAFSNPEHVKFALKGCLAASLCYIFYNAKDWPGISTAVTTCFLTALSTIGSSRQKQLLRITGALAGGALGVGAQIFVLPHLDSIGGFTLLFAAVTVLADCYLPPAPLILRGSARTGVLHRQPRGIQNTDFACAGRGTVSWA